MAKITFCILIPLASNEGVTYTEHHHAVFISEIWRHGLNFTSPLSFAEGSWERKVESSLILLIAVESPLKSAEAILRLAEFAKVHYSQDAIYVDYLGIAEIL